MGEEKEENIETPIEETENENGSEMENGVIEIPQRVNPFCVICKDAIKVEDINGKKHDLHLVETNSGWRENPYGEAYAVVPDEMVQAILETKGFCDIELNEDGTEVVSFTAREIPEIPAPTPEQKEDGSVWDEMANAITEGVNEV